MTYDTLENKIGKYRRATQQERDAWSNETVSPDFFIVSDSLYELNGFIVYNDLELPIEKTDEGLYEVHAPVGKHFTPDLLHTMLCDGMADLRERLAVCGLESCGEECS